MFDFRYKNDKDYFKLPKEKIEESLTLCKKVMKNFKNNDILVKKGGSKNNGDNLIIDYYNVDKVLIKIFSFLSHSVMWNMYEKNLKIKIYRFLFLNFFTLTNFFLKIS